MTPRATPPCPPTPKHNLPRVPRLLTFWGSFIAVHAQDVKTGLDQPFGCLPVEMSLGVAAAWRELEAIMRTPCGQPLRYGVRVSFHDHGQVRAVSLGIEMPQKGPIDNVQPL